MVGRGGDVTLEEGDDDCVGGVEGERYCLEH